MRKINTVYEYTEKDAISIAFFSFARNHGYPVGILNPSPMNCPVHPDLICYREGMKSMSVFVLTTLQECHHFFNAINPHLDMCPSELVAVVTTDKHYYCHQQRDIMTFKVQTAENKDSRFKPYVGNLKIRVRDESGELYFIDYSNDLKIWLPDYEDRTPNEEISKDFAFWCMFAMTRPKTGTYFNLSRPKSHIASLSNPARAYTVKRRLEELAVEKEKILDSLWEDDNERNTRFE